MLHLLISAWMICCIGCSATLRFEVIDAQTGAPLNEARVRHVRDTISYFSKAPEGHVMLKPSGDDGIVEARRLEPNFAHYFTFSKDGYRDAHVLAGSRGGWNPIDFSSPPQGAKIWSDMRQISQHHGIYQIPMHRQP
jgi:hypothetical protein